MVNHMSNRKQRRQDKYKYKKKITTGESKSNPIFIMGGMLLVFVSFYLITDYLNPKPLVKNLESEIKPVYIQYQEILAGSTFNINKSQYYVLFYNSDKFYKAEIEKIISSYRKENKVSLYIVNLNNGLNKNYIFEESNSSAQSAAELKVKDLTLIKIENNKNTSYLEGIENIKTELGVEN